MAYFYRRSSGRYYARIRVPEALLPHFRTQELRRSLNTTDRALACHLALAAALQWKAEFARLSGDMDLMQLSAGSPLLLSDGYVSLADAAPQMGLSVAPHACGGSSRTRRRWVTARLSSGSRMRSVRSTHCYALWRCETESRLMDYAQLRLLLEPLITGLKDAGTHTMLPTFCEELGLPVPITDGSKRERMASSFEAAADTDLPAIARKLLMRHPLVLCDPHACQGFCAALNRLLQTMEHKLNVIEEVTSLDMMLTLVGAGYGIGFMSATKIPVSQRPDVVIRPLAMDSALITTYLLRSEKSEFPGSLERFINRLRAPPTS